jgi:OPT oligopeptide transporter protein
MWILSLFFALLGSATNLLFSLRYPSVAITPVIALILVHPIGLIWDGLVKRPDDPPVEFVDGFRISPLEETSSGRRRTRFRRWLAQGSWNEKEHACVYVSSNVAFGFAFATDVGVLS